MIILTQINSEWSYHPLVNMLNLSSALCSEGVNGVNCQPSNGQKIDGNRQKRNIFTANRQMSKLLLTVKNRPISIYQIQPKTIDLNTRLRGINPTNSVFIPMSLVLRSIVLNWILIYRNWSIKNQTIDLHGVNCKLWCLWMIVLIYHKNTFTPQALYILVSIGSGR